MRTKIDKYVSLTKYMFFDAIAITTTYLIALVMFIVIETPVDQQLLFMALPFIVGFKLIVFLMTGLYRMLANHIGFEDVMKISMVIVITNVVIVLFLLVYPQYQFMYKSVYFFISIAEMVLVTLPRISNRLIIYLKTNMYWTKSLGRNTLIVGAGDAGELVVKEIYRNKDLYNRPIAFLDDDPKKIGNRLLGIKIVGPISEILSYIDSFHIEEVIIAINQYPKHLMQELINQTTQRNVRIKKLISMTDLSESHQQPVITDVKIEDLLNRDEICLDDDQIKLYVKDEVVLVTGGGGSIGSELCRQIAECEPKMLIIFDIYENNAYEIQQELIRKFHKTQRPLHLEVLIGSVYNLSRLEQIFKTYQPTLVYHAAAYKHVPLMEDSAVEAVRTNVIGTYNTAYLAQKYKVKKFVLVSSDKAVRSTNVMGATKRYAELIIQEQQTHTQSTKFVAVRFGNVLGSNGSVIPLFKNQIADGGPVTVTHPDITRYFMTIPEAVGLILQCGVYAQGGEIFILDMGEPVKISELAEKMISLTGLRPHIDIQIEYTGLRPGEKLFEELLVDHNHHDHHTTNNDKIFIEKQRPVTETELELKTILNNIENLTNLEVKDFVASIVKTYKRNGD